MAPQGDNRLIIVNVDETGRRAGEAAKQIGPKRVGGGCSGVVDLGEFQLQWAGWGLTLTHSRSTSAGLANHELGFPGQGSTEKSWQLPGEPQKKARKTDSTRHPRKIGLWSATHRSPRRLHDSRLASHTSPTLIPAIRWRLPPPARPFRRPARRSGDAVLPPCPPGSTSSTPCGSCRPRQRAPPTPLWRRRPSKKNGLGGRTRQSA